jgi:hypothetical protein
MHASQLPQLIRPWLTGRCFDFALALAEKLPGAEFVVIGTAACPDHVALRLGDTYYDARGAMDEAAFLTSYRSDCPFRLEEVGPIARDVVELNAGCGGVEPPYVENRDIAQARRAVAKIFGRKFAPPVAQVPEEPTVPGYR